MWGKETNKHPLEKWARDMNRQFIKEEKHVRRRSNTVFIRQLLMKKLKRCCFTPNVLTPWKCLVGEGSLRLLGSGNFSIPFSYSKMMQPLERQRGHNLGSTISSCRNLESWNMEKTHKTFTATLLEKNC